MKETAILFGKLETLAGVVTDPDCLPNPRSRPTILLLNAGLLHRVGPNRLYVRLARALASAGFVTLRFDFSSIGDSKPRRDDLTRAESSLTEAQEAMDFLAVNRGAERFVLIGLCGGAANAFRVTRDDQRVVGAVMIDWYAYRTAGYYLRHYARRLVRRRSWLNVFAGRNATGRMFRRIFSIGNAIHSGVNPVGVSYIRTFPPRDAVLSDLKLIVDRDVSLYFIYSEGGMEAYYNYESQFEDMFPSLCINEKLRVKLFHEADHTFTLLSHQQTLIDDVEGWVSTNFNNSEQT